MYGLTSQIRKASISVPSNIAEGAGRGTNKDFSNFLNISLGSAFELETQLIIAEKLELIKMADLEDLLIENQGNSENDKRTSEIN